MVRSRESFGTAVCLNRDMTIESVMNASDCLFGANYRGDSRDSLAYLRYDCTAALETGSAEIVLRLDPESCDLRATMPCLSPASYLGHTLVTGMQVSGDTLRSATWFQQNGPSSLTSFSFVRRSLDLRACKGVERGHDQGLSGDTQRWLNHRSKFGAMVAC
jgi:hypothetical protein